MKASKLSLIPALLVCGTSLCAGIARSQTPDRISSFTSQITVDRDRTVHVQERFEITNDRGVFDNGFHRRWWIKPAGPHRLKVGSFESIRVKVDGQDAVFHGIQDGKLFDIGVATGTASLSRGNHVLELGYTAKHQFTIHDGYDDLNQDVSGEWPVPIETAQVELNFPQGYPPQAAISADTGTDSDFKFDCLRTDLPSGMSFQTTHALSPGKRLFVSARFPHSSYFVSNVKEDGYRAVLQNHPRLVPSLVAFCGSIVLALAGFTVWRRSPGSISARSPDAGPPLVFWREVLKMYLFPIVMFALAIIPGLNFTYSGHGGPSWFLVPLCFPWVIVRILIKIAKGPEESSRWYKRFFKITIPSYIVIALPLSWVAVTSIRMAFGLPVSTWGFFVLMVSPFPWWYFS
jgi:hypothetical protein